MRSNKFLLIALFILMVSAISAQDNVMVTDGIQHSVELEKIIFDDFDNRSNRALRYTNATAADIERLRDRIRPLCYGEIDECLTPAYESVADANTWLSELSVVMGYIDEDGQAYAYSFKILNFHEIVNETLADVPVLITYCPLCNSAIVYSREIDGEELIFGNTSALYESDMVMYDLQTGSYWFQAEGRAILGENTNQLLDILPSVITTWEQWRSDHPDTLSLARPVPQIDYRRDIFVRYADSVNQGRFVFPVSEEAATDDCLKPAENVLVVTIGDESVAYPPALLGDAATTDTVGDEEIVVLTLESGASAAAYSTILSDGSMVDLVYEDSGRWRDTNSDSIFDLNGHGVSGSLAGTQLAPVRARYLLWFSAITTTPDVVVYGAE